MESMMNAVELQMVRKLFEEKQQAILTHTYMLDDLASEILMLDNPNSMREVALYMKEIIRQMEMS